MDKIALRIKQKREEMGFSVDKLAKKIGKSRATLYRYENGFIEKMPSNVLSDIANALGVTPAYLLGWEDEFTQQKQELAKIIDELNEEELAELSNFVDYIISKRK
jgi:transcriptional regulator with XRE-family HTH domain